MLRLESEKNLNQANIHGEEQEKAATPEQDEKTKNVQEEMEGKDPVKEVYDELVDQDPTLARLAVQHPGRIPNELLRPFYVIDHIYETFGEETLRKVAPRLGRNMEIWDKFLEANRDVKALVEKLLDE